MKKMIRNDIMLATLFCIPNNSDNPMAVRASEYVNTSYIIGYLKDDKFVDKFGIAYNIHKADASIVGGNPVITWKGAKPKQDEVYADIVGILDVDTIKNIPTDNIFNLLNFVENEFYNKLINAPAKERLNIKTKTLK